MSARRTTAQITLTTAQSPRHPRVLAPVSYTHLDVYKRQDYVGSDDMIAKIQGGWLDFDAVVATPDLMGKVGRLGKVCLLYTSRCV